MMESATGKIGSAATTGRLYKRTYRGLREYLSDMLFIAGNMRQALRLMKGNAMSSAFRERLMLAVVSVYGCRYCSWAHTGAALRSGVTPDEISALLAGTVDSCPEDEAIALLYAQHWADSDASPDPEAVRRLEEAYGVEKARLIELALRMIRVGNLSGNTWDLLLRKVSFGRWGRTPQPHEV